MRSVKQYLPSLFTLALIALGAAMPWLVSWGQDARIGNRQEKLELNVANLTLQEDAGVGPALEVVSRELASVPWSEETQLTEWAALEEAEEVIRQMRDLDLLSTWEAELLAAGPDGWAEPVLVIADDSTALVWNCYWAVLPCVVTVDDVSGKAVRFVVEGTAGWMPETDGALPQQAAEWDLFFQDYYGSEVAAELYLRIHDGYVTFNY